MSNVNSGEDIADDGQRVKSYPRRPLRATMSLANFEEQTRNSAQNEIPPGNYGQRTLGTAATPEEFVTKFGGKRVINKILIANNGIAGNSTNIITVRWASFFN